MDWLRRMMAGRYGMDYMNNVLLWAGLVVSVLNMFLRVRILSYFVWLIWAYVIFRLLSHNIPARSRENQWFMGWFEPLKWKVSGKAGTLHGQFENWKSQRAYQQQQKANYAFFKCPNCKQKIRVPRGRGKVAVTCPKCENVFHKTT